MRKCLGKPVSMLKRTVYAVLLSSPFFASGFFALRVEASDVHQRIVVTIASLFIIAGITVISIIMASPVARLFAEPWGGIFFPNQCFKGTQPMYGIPETKRAMGLHLEALAEYEKIRAAYPSELKPYIEMIGIAIDDLEDPEWAKSIYQRGMATLKKDQDKENLTRVYNTMLR